MKYILHFKDGHDEVKEIDRALSHWFDEMEDIESWEDWYPEWQGNQGGGVQNALEDKAVVE